MMYAGRTLNGLGVGSVTSIIPVFIADFSPSAVQGRVVGIYEMMYHIGAVVRFWINYGTAWHILNSSTAQWRIPIAVQIIAGSVLFVSMFVIRYLFCMVRCQPLTPPPSPRPAGPVPPNGGPNTNGGPGPGSYQDRLLDSAADHRQLHMGLPSPPIHHLSLATPREVCTQIGPSSFNPYQP
ncbi:hypothetical protein JB92DRAFT_3053900 [Gautieria morchelliformis]|nr:hypothetical protein JB92DRAFT_3053900 [Gautieria morchelliformis]